MSYELTLQKAGAEVIEYKEVGSYQGDWGAVVNYKGKKVLVIGSYGSCSGCDSFQSEFDYCDPRAWNDEKTGKYYRGYQYDTDDEITKEQYDEIIADLDKRYAEFGETYLQNPLGKEDIERKLASLDNEDWFDLETKELYEWAYGFFK